MLNVFICCFSKQRPSKVCVLVSTATLPTKTISYENVDISASEHTQLENGGRKFEEAAGIVVRDCCEYVIKRPPLLIFFFLCLLLDTALKFAKAKDFAIYAGSNFSYSEK